MKQPLFSCITIAFIALSYFYMFCTNDRNGYSHRLIFFHGRSIFWKTLYIHDSSSLACRNSYCVHLNVSNSLLPLTVFGRESCLKICYPLEQSTRYEISLQFLVYIIRFERILKTRSENSEKLGKGLFNYDLPSESRKNTFAGLKNPQNCLFSSHLFFRQSWTKVLGHICVSGAFSNSHRSSPSPHPTNNVGRVHSEFFPRFNFV